MSETGPETDGRTIPRSVRHDELMAAMMPLYDLLGVSPYQLYDLPGIQIGGDRITFVIPALTAPEEWAKSRPIGRLVDFNPQRDSGRIGAELQQVVSVEVKR